MPFVRDRRRRSRRVFSFRKIPDDTWGCAGMPSSMSEHLPWSQIPPNSEEADEASSGVLRSGRPVPRSSGSSATRAQIV